MSTGELFKGDGQTGVGGVGGGELTARWRERMREEGELF